jgi:hypothetical protein
MKIIVVLSLISTLLTPTSSLNEVSDTNSSKLVIASFSGSVGSLAGYKIEAIA